MIEELGLTEFYRSQNFLTPFFAHYEFCNILLLINVYNMPQNDLIFLNIYVFTYLKLCAENHETDFYRKITKETSSSYKHYTHYNSFTENAQVKYNTFRVPVTCAQSILNSYFLPFYINQRVTQPEYSPHPFKRFN